MHVFEFKDVRFMTAKEKRRVLTQWVRFLKSGFNAKRFMKSLYAHLVSHSGFIAHFCRTGFVEVYFLDPSATQRFLDQFDRSKGCLSVEYGGCGWMEYEDYRDINSAMVDAAAELLPELRRVLRERETAKAREELARAERRLNEILKAG